MTTELYYTPPKDEIFNEVKEKAIELWREIDTDNDKYGYATSKIDRIKDIANIKDNFMYMVAMFSDNNHILLANKLSNEARKEIRKRMIDGGSSAFFIAF
jgi:septation ring formation regulator EzrA